MIGGNLQPGDILLTGGHGPIFDRILWATTAPGEPRSTVGHVGLIDTGGTLLSAYVLEAAMGRVYPNQLRRRYYNSETLIAVARPVNLTHREMQEVLRASRSLEGRKYGYTKIALQAGDALLCKALRRDIYLFRRLAKVGRWPICSWHVGFAFDAVGLDFGIDYRGVTPDDIHDYIVSHSNAYVWVYGPEMKTVRDWLDRGRSWPLPAGPPPAVPARVR